MTLKFHKKLFLIKERQLLSTSNTLRQQLAAAKRGLQQLEFKEEQLLAGNSSGSGGGAAGESLEQEVASLRMVLEMRRVEVGDQPKDGPRDAQVGGG